MIKPTTKPLETKAMLMQKNSLTQVSLSFWLIIVAIINTMSMTAISLTLGNWQTSFIGKVYLVGAMTTQFVIINFIIALILYLLARPISSQSWRIKMFVVTFTVAHLIIITNLKVYSLYHFHLNGMVLNLLMGGALLENLAFSFAMWLSIAIAIIVAFLLEYIVVKMALRYTLTAIPRTGKYITISLVAMMLLQLTNGFSDAFAWKEITQQNRYIPWMQAATMRKQLVRLGFTITTEKNSTLKNEFSALQYPLEPLNCATQSPPNIVMLVVDSLRADMVTPEIMPNTFSLQSNALVFNNHFSTGNSTRYGLFGLMYGLPGNYWNAMLQEEKGSLLFDVTQNMHYQHFIYGSSKLTFPEFDRTIFTALKTQLNEGSGKSSADNDKEIATKLIHDIRYSDKKKPFFGFAFFESPHAYSLPEKYPKLFQPMLTQVNYMALHNEYDATPFLNRYKTAGHFVDTLIADIHQELVDKKLLQNTLLIITSDHGQEFNETKQNYWGHNSNFSQWQTKVPLIMFWPDIKPSATPYLTSHEDVVPTIMQNALGCTTKIEKFSTGKNLLGDITGDRSLLLESWTERAIKHEKKLYLFNSVGSLSTLDENYNTLDNAEIPAALLQTNLARMSQFTKKLFIP